MSFKAEPLLMIIKCPFELRRHFQIKLPWPLLACIEASNSISGLEEFASRIEKGEMGKLEDWQKAEER